MELKKLEKVWKERMKALDSSPRTVKDGSSIKGSPDLIAALRETEEVLRSHYHIIMPLSFITAVEILYRKRGRIRVNDFTAYG